MQNNNVHCVKVNVGSFVSMQFTVNVCSAAYDLWRMENVCFKSDVRSFDVIFYNVCQLHELYTHTEILCETCFQKLWK